MSHFQPESKLCRVQEMISTELEQETVLMNIDTGTYYGMEATAQCIWQALEIPLTFSALIERLTKEYDVAPDACAADVEKFLSRLEQEGLLHVE